MKKAINQNGKMVDIIESIKTDIYICPICKEVLTRNFGEKSQYYSHPKGKGNNCELKLKLMIKEGELELSEEQEDLLQNEYYDKNFDDKNIILSDYESEDGHYLTQEQKDIIFAQEDRIKISALAGTGKTNTLYYYAKERPHKKILYLVYNKAMKNEAEKTFGKLSHVTIKTTHGLAYGYVGKYYRNKLTNKYGVIDVIKDLRLNWKTQMELAVKIDKMMNEYSLSDVEEFNDIDLFEDNEKDIIVKCCKMLWELKKDYNNNIKITHDDYLKMFQLSKMDLSNKYDTIMLDECQDSSRLIFGILNSSNIKNIVIVGDQKQQLYQWRRSINIMPLFEGKEYKLTTSFRVSQNTANIANYIIKDFSKEDINMKGFNKKQKIVDKINKNEPYVCLCRTNAFILAEVFEVLNRNRYSKLFFEGGYSSYNFNNIKDAYYFSIGHSVKNYIFNKFKDYHEMLEYANQTNDLEILALHRMVNKYGSKIPSIIDGIKNNTTNDKDKANVLFSTIHRSKGQTYLMPVYISDDHFDMVKIFKEEYIEFEEGEVSNLDNHYEEMCIVYVALTRAGGEVELSQSMKEYLTVRHKFFK